MTSTVLAPAPALRPPRHRPHPRAVGWWATRSALVVLPVPVTLGILFLTIPPARTVFGGLTLATLVPALAALVLEPLWRYRVHRWEVTDTAVYVTAGWFWRSWRIVPLSRVQSIDTVRGPVEQLFGLSGVAVTTAALGRPVRLAGLDHRTAADLAERMAAVVEVTPEAGS